MGKGKVRFQNNNKWKLGLAWRHTVWVIVYVTWSPGGRERRVRFQNNNNLKLGLAQRHTVWAIVYVTWSPGAKGGRRRLGLLSVTSRGHWPCPRVMLTTFTTPLLFPTQSLTKKLWISIWGFSADEHSTYLSVQQPFPSFSMSSSTTRLQSCVVIKCPSADGTRPHTPEFLL